MLKKQTLALLAILVCSSAFAELYVVEEQARVGVGRIDPACLRGDKRFCPNAPWRVYEKEEVDELLKAQSRRIELMRMEHQQYRDEIKRDYQQLHGDITKQIGDILTKELANQITEDAAEITTKRVLETLRAQGLIP
jgi:hypothetical protein